MSSPLFVQDSISRAQSASPFPGHQHKMASQSQASVQFVVFRDHLTAYNSVSRDGFVSSHTVRYHRISLMRGLARAYIATADCAPYHENCTRMAELTTMLSWTINACEIGPDRVGGMLQDTIQTSHQYHGLHTRLLNTCRKIATSRMTALTNQTDRDATLDVLKEMANASGQRSYLHQTKTAFLNHSRKMIRVLWWFVTETSDNTLGGDTPLNDDIMNRLPGSPSESTSTKESKRSLHESDSEVGTFYCRGLRPPAPPAMRGATRAPCTPFAAHSHTRILCGWPLARRVPRSGPLPGCREPVSPLLTEL